MQLKYANLNPSLKVQTTYQEFNREVYDCRRTFFEHKEFQGLSKVAIKIDDALAMSTRA